MLSGEIKQKKCAVPGCEDTISPTHRFPLEDKLTFDMWVNVVKHPHFSARTPEQIYRSFVVCNRHFSDDARVPGTKRGLKVGAIPTLYLPSVTGEVVLEEKSSSVEVTRSVRSLEESPHHDSDLPTSSKRQKMSDDYEEVIDVPLGTPASSQIQEFPHIEEEHITLLKTSPGPKRKGKRRSILRAVNVTRQNQLTPKAKKLYKIITDWGVKVAGSSRKIRNLEARLAEAEKIASSPNFKNLTEAVNKTTYTFILCQIRNRMLPPRGRRFSMEEKILSLALMKSSGKGYSLLSKILAFPSKQTIFNLLRKIPLNPGINRHIFQSLKVSVDKMSRQERCCILVFDEMSIDMGLQYNQKNDIMEGIEDFGNERNAKLSDHANVFMVKGAYKNWIQPISFTFSNGPVTSDKLMVLIKTVVYATYITFL